MEWWQRRHHFREICEVGRKLPYGSSSTVISPLS
jgi:hypothetical protein